MPQQADVVSAFQIPPLHEKIAVTMPKGFLHGGMSVGICEKNVRGLKQASKAWGSMAHNWIVQYDDRVVPCIKAGRCMYAIWTEDLKFLCVRWVDSFYAVSSDGNRFLNTFLKAMGKEFPLKLLGDMKQVLGTEVIW